MSNQSDEKRVAKVLSAIPNNWLDPLLSGPKGIKVPADCDQIEKLLNGVRERVRVETKALLAIQHKALKPKKLAKGKRR